MARDLRAEFRLRTFALHGSAGAKFEGLSQQERAYGFHAGEVETAFLLASVPEFVDRSAYTVNYIADVAEPEAAAAGKCPRHLCLAHARHRAQRRDGRSAASDCGKRRALARPSRRAACGSLGGHASLPESAGAVTNAGIVAQGAICLAS